jgi:acetyl-CoA carboxylase biotin carboxylase subunit
LGDLLFEKVLVANRGEIALRIIRACKELGIATVAVFSEADTQSLHVRFADEDVCIGPAKSHDSYLDPKRIISAAEVTNADAVHPGYGFLAENPDFAEICESCDIKFIGPSSETIRLMGDKALAKETMSKAGVPVIPGSDGVVESPQEALNLAHQIGFPVIIKASFGGGGKGMRIAESEGELEKGFQMAKLEAEAAFGNAEVYLEKYIPNPRHIEIQVLGDGSGEVIHFGERDCSLQRRHQKLLEECPSPVVDQKLRERMGEVAVRGAKSVNYESAGTVEFLLDEDKQFYFMEMNTRIQVEHPVTEEVTDVDLVKEQIRVASGEKLKLSQQDIQLKGHAIECRINAEDPRKGFLPAPGTITSFHVPGGHGIRVDTHAYARYQIPAYYDSMIAKLIAHGKSREEAILKARRALDEFIIEGIPTTIEFHKSILRDKRFISGQFGTSLIDQILKEQLQEVGKT